MTPPNLAMNCKPNGKSRLKACIRALQVLASAFLFPAMGRAAQTPTPLTIAWSQGDQHQIHAFASSGNDRNYLKLSDQEIADLAVPIAQWIPIQPALDASPNQTWRNLKDEEDWNIFMGNLRGSNPIVKRWFLGVNAASVCRHLAENGRLKTQAVIPYLISGLDHPCGNVDMNCYYALQYLTRLHNDDANIWYDSPQKIRALKKWYSDWWDKNQNKDLIVDAELQQRVDDCFLKVCNQIKAATANVHHSLHGFNSPAPNSIPYSDSNILLETEFFPDHQSRETKVGDIDLVNNVILDLGRMGEASWIWIGVVSQAQFNSKIPDWMPASDPTAGFPKQARQIYRKDIPNSYWQIEVYTSIVPDADNAILVSNLKKSF
jgi:hypothetical protein